MSAKAEVHVVALTCADDKLLFHTRPGDERWHMPSARLRRNPAREVRRRAMRLVEHSYGCIPYKIEVPMRSVSVSRVKIGEPIRRLEYWVVIAHVQFSEVSYGNEDTDRILLANPGQAPEPLHCDLEKILMQTREAHHMMRARELEGKDIEDIKTRPQKGVTRV